MFDQLDLSVCCQKDTSLVSNQDQAEKRRNQDTTEKFNTQICVAIKFIFNWLSYTTTNPKNNVRLYIVRKCFFVLKA